MTRPMVLALALALAAASSLQAQNPLAHSSLGSVVPVSEIRNPAVLRATEILGRATPGVAPRIRFEWEQVPRAAAYVLSGQWTDRQSWAVRSIEYRVTARNATSWKTNLATFEVSLPEGNHSWKLVAIFGPNDAGDFESPAHVSFNLR